MTGIKQADEISYGEHNRKRILILARKNLAYNTRVLRQAQALAGAGWSVDVGCLEPPIGWEQVEGVRFIPIEMKPWTKRLWGFFQPATKHKPSGGGAASRNAPGFMRRCLMPFHNFLLHDVFARAAKKALQGRSWDVVQAHDAPALLAASRLAADRSAAFAFDALEIYGQETILASTIRSGWQRALELKLYAKLARLADGVCAAGPSIARHVQNAFGVRKVSVVRNCRPLRQVGKSDRLRAELGVGSDARIAVVVGAIYQGQGLQAVQHALRLLPENVHIVFIGPQPDEGYVRSVLEKARKEGLSGRLHVLDTIPSEQLVDFISGSNVGLIVRDISIENNRLSLPNKLFEMIQARLPVVCTDMVDTCAVVDQYSIGAFFENRTPEVLAEAIERILREETEGVFDQPLEHAAAELCWEREQLHYIAFIESVV